MASKVPDNVKTKFGSREAGITNLPMKVTLIAGGAAGDHTVAGITTRDQLISVIHNTSGALVDLTSEFTISDDDTINNDDGTATTSDQLLVFWADLS